MMMCVYEKLWGCDEYIASYFSTTVPISMQVFSAASRNAGSGWATFTKSAWIWGEWLILNHLAQGNTIKVANWMNKAVSSGF